MVPRLPDAAGGAVLALMFSHSKEPPTNLVGSSTPGHERLRVARNILWYPHAQLGCI